MTVGTTQICCRPISTFSRKSPRDMSLPNVDEHQIAHLMKDFTRAALLTQPTNLVEFGRQYFNQLDTSLYVKSSPAPQPEASELPKQDDIPESFTLEALRELYNMLLEFELDQLQDGGAVKNLCTSVGTWNSQMEILLDSKAGELSKGLIFLMACSVDADDHRKNFVDSIRTVFDAVGDNNGTTLEIQQLVDYFADLALFHEEIDPILADQVVQHLLGSGFIETDADLTNKFDGNNAMTFEELVSAPCLQEWLSSQEAAI